MLLRIWSNRDSHSLLEGMQNDTATFEDSLTIFYKTKHSLTIQPRILLLSIYSIDLKFYVYMKPAYEYLFTVTKNWKQPRFPSMGEWKNKLWHIHKMEYYSVLKGNGVLCKSKDIDES